MTAPPPLPTIPCESATVVSPVRERERIVAIDVLRGVAILGILLMNIQSFSMPVSAYSYPWSWGDMSGANGLVYFLSHILASGKFLSIFAMLFGAGIVLQHEHLRADHASAQIHFRRMFILIGFGLAHAYLLWYGDILFSYGVLGLLVFVFRGRSIRLLALVAAAFFLAGLLMNLAQGGAMYAFGTGPNGGIDHEFNPSYANQLIEVNAYRGPWIAQMRQRVPVAMLSQTFVLFTYCLPFVTAQMLAGMALMKSGFFKGSWRRSRYGVIALIGITVGWSLSALGLWIDAKTGRNPTLSVMVLSHVNTIAMVPTAIGYSAAVILMATSPMGRFLFPLAAVGRTALSCYLIQTVICTTLFYGHGLGWFGRIERTDQLIIVGCVWIALLGFASIWTHFFRYGPAEWAWRAMTYGLNRV